MRRLFDRIRRFVRDRVRGPSLRTYDDALDELGGVPWRAFGSTERWFLATPPPPPLRPDPPPLPLDTADFRLRGPSLGERAAAITAWLAARRVSVALTCAAVFVALVVAVALSHAAPPAPRIVAPTIAGPPAVAFAPASTIAPATRASAPTSTIATATSANARSPAHAKTRKHR